MYYFSFIPNRSFTIPLKHFGTFFTTIVIFFTLLFHFFNISHLQDNHANPIATTAIPMANNQPDIGSNKTSNIPRPNPIKHTPSVFFNAHNITIILLSFSLYYIPFLFIFNPRKKCSSYYTFFYHFIQFSLYFLTLVFLPLLVLLLSQ